MLDLALLVFVSLREGVMMNLPFMHSREKARREVMAAAVTPPTKLITNASVRAELVPSGVEKYETDTLLKCLIYGFFEGLHDVDFDLKILAGVPDIQQKLMDEAYELPDFIWGKINELSCEQQAWVIYIMMRFAHVRSALKMVRDPESLAGKEFLVLPLQLAGEDNFLDKLERVRPYLPRFGLNKGQTQGEVNGVDYPTVLSVFSGNREQFLRTYGLDNFEAMARFILTMDQRLDYFPEELMAVFRDSETLLNTIDNVGKYFFSPRLHPQYFRQ